MNSVRASANTEQVMPSVAAPMAWDPRCPARLFLPDNETPSSSTSTTHKDAETTGGSDIEAKGESSQTVLAGSGGGYLWSEEGAMECNSYERAALFEILQAHDEYCHQLDRLAVGVSSTLLCRQLLRHCRKALQGCIQGWVEFMDQEEEAGAGRDMDLILADDLNLQLLKLSFATLHLADIFVFLLPTSSPPGVGPAAEYHPQYNPDPFVVPGAVTADTVRYLRYQHMIDASAVVAESGEDEIAAMKEARRPEDYIATDLGGTGAFRGGSSSEDSTLFWKYLRVLVLRGCLVEAWEVLQLHSLYKNATTILESNMMNATDTTVPQSPDLQYSHQIVDYFLILKEVLLRAPLPAGRQDTWDDQLQDTWDGDEDEDKEQTHESDYYLDGLPVGPQDYKFWERPRPHQYDEIDDVENDEWEIQARRRRVAAMRADLPVNYLPQAAQNKFTTWQSFVRDTIRPQMVPLSQKIPPLDGVLAILTGDFSAVQMEDELPSWAESLCATLLYQKPHIRPCDIANEAKKHMQSKDVAAENLIMLDLMEGHAAAAIENLLHFGGNSGAALPTALTALTFSTFIEMGVVSEGFADRKRELLCDAAWSIVSSLSNSNYDHGIRAALRLLVPHAVDPRSGGNHGNSKTGAINDYIYCIANILEHYAPQSDVSATDVVGLCEPLLQKKSLIILEACEAILLSRFRAHLRRSDPGEAFQWLAHGLKERLLVLGEATAGSCYNKICALCTSATTSLLLQILVGESTDAQIYRDTEAIVTSVKSHSALVGDFVLTDVKEVMVLLHIKDLVDSFILEQDYVLAAQQVLACLDEHEDKVTGTVGSLIPLSLQWPLLHISKIILQKEEEEGSVQKCAFDKSGIRLLLETVHRVETFDPTKSASFDASFSPVLPTHNSEISEFRELLAKMLKRAYEAENALLQQTTWSLHPYPQLGKDINSMRTMNMHEFPIAQRDEMVYRMYDF